MPDFMYVEATDENNDPKANYHLYAVYFTDHSFDECFTGLIYRTQIKKHKNDKILSYEYDRKKANSTLLIGSNIQCYDKGEPGINRNLISLTSEGTVVGTANMFEDWACGDLRKKIVGDDCDFPLVYMDGETAFVDLYDELGFPYLGLGSRARVYLTYENNISNIYFFRKNPDNPLTYKDLVFDSYETLVKMIVNGTLECISITKFHRNNEMIRDYFSSIVGSYNKENTPISAYRLEKPAFTAFLNSKE